jgi:hypothetical protein
MPIKATAITKSKPAPCMGFTLEVKVVPNKNLKLHVVVDKTCVSNEARWALLFTLEKRIDGEWVEIVFVSYKPKLDDIKANQGIEKMLIDEKLSKKQLAIAKEEIIPVTAELEGTAGPTPAQAKKIEAASRKLAVAEIGG